MKPWQKRRRARKLRLQEEEDECTANGGVWRTIRGTHVCIRKGESVDAALKRTLGDDYEGESPKGKDTTKEPSTQKNKKQSLSDKINASKVDSEYKNEYKEFVTDIVKQLPESDTEKIKNITIEPSLEAFTKNGKKYFQAGNYRVSTGEIQISQEFLVGEELSKQYLYHEAGHNKWFTDTTFSQQNDFGHLMDNYADKLPSDYARINIEEAYAECYQNYHRGKDLFSPFKRFFDEIYGKIEKWKP